MNFRHLLGCDTTEAMKIVHHHANGRFDWLIFEYQNINPSKEAISILSGKYKRFTFVHPVPADKTLKFEENCMRRI